MLIAVPVVHCNVEDMGVKDTEGVLMTAGRCATCPKCGTKARAPGTTAKASRLAINEMARQCPERKAGTGTHHYYRDETPEGVRIEYEHRGEWLRAYRIKNTIYSLAGPILETVPVRVKYDKGRMEAAAKVWQFLANHGYHLKQKCPGGKKVEAK